MSFVNRIRRILSPGIEQDHMEDLWDHHVIPSKTSDTQVVVPGDKHVPDHVFVCKPKKTRRF